MRLDDDALAGDAPYGRCGRPDQYNSESSACVVGMCG